MADRTKVTMTVLIVLVVILAIAVVYAFVVGPAISDYVANKQISAYNQGQSDLLNNILLNIQQVGFVRIPVGNQSLVLAPVQNPQAQ